MKRLIIGSFAYVLTYKFELLKALFLPLLAITAFDVIAYSQESVRLFSLLSEIAYIFLYALVAIRTHRIILLGPSSVPKWGINKITKREVSFILYIIGFVLIMIIPSLLSLVPGVGFYLAITGFIYVAARLSLVFPAIATDQYWSFSESWKATSKHQGKMIVAVVLIPLIATLPTMLFALIPYGQVFNAILSSIILIFTISALSVSFKIVKESHFQS